MDHHYQLHLDILLDNLHGKVDWGDVSPHQPTVGVFSDSRKVVPGSVFVAVPGVTTNGHDFLPQAVSKGAILLVVEQRDQIPAHYKGAVLQVLQSKWALAALLSRFYSMPQDKMIGIAITGTNGKTSSSYILEALLNAAGLPCGVMGTINHHLGSHVWPTGLTTPDTETFFNRAHEFVNLGAKAYAMEVSSHSLHQKRVPIQFDIALFTNFTRDHLDYHGTMEEYFKSKQLLFTEQLKTQGDVFAVINADDPQVAKVAVAAGVQKITFGQNAADFQFSIQRMDIRGTHFQLRDSQGRSYSYTTPLIGEYNVYNVVGCIAAVHALGVPHFTCQTVISSFLGVPGRLQKVLSDRGPHVFVDYAHTPDALEKTILNLRRVCTPEQKIHVVFGCGGDRDPGKRPAMGAIAAEFADHVMITSDNPRSEDPQLILNQIAAGVPETQQAKVQTEIDRRRAIELVLQQAAVQDVVLVAGKGHENYQILKDKTIPFDDVAVADDVLKKIDEL